MASDNRTLNDGYDFNRELSIQGLHEVKESFLRWPPQKELLWPTGGLYRFVRKHDPLLKPGKNGGDYYSPYWIRKATLDQIGRYHNDTKIPMPELARGLLSIAFDFKKTIDSILAIRLRHKVYAFLGPSRALPALVDPKKRPDLNRELHNIYSLGMLEQVYVPNLTPEYVSSHQHLYLEQWGSSTLLYFG